MLPSQGQTSPVPSMDQCVNVTHPGDFTSSQYRAIALIQLILLSTVFLISLLENIIFFCISIDSLHRRILLRLERLRYRHSVVNNGESQRMLSRKSTLMPQNGDRLESMGECRPMKRRSLPHTSTQLQHMRPESSGEMHRHSSYRNHMAVITPLYFGNLCAANLALALLAMPLSISATLGTRQLPENVGASRKWVEPHNYLLLSQPLIINDLFCTTIESVIGGILMVSTLSLVLLTADRLIAICRPLHYSRWITRHRAVITISLLWFLSFALFTVPHVCRAFLRFQRTDRVFEAGYQDLHRCFVLGQRDTDKHWELAILYFTLVFAAPLLFISASYIVIHITVKRCTVQMNRITRIRSSDHGLVLSNTWPHSSSRGISDGTFPTSRPNRIAMVQTKAAKTAFVFVTVFLVLTAPYFSLMLVGAIQRNNATSQTASDHERIMLNCGGLEMAEMLSAITVWFLYVNSFLTPGLYCFRDGVLRKRFNKLCTIGRHVRWGRPSTIGG